MERNLMGCGAVARRLAMSHDRVALVVTVDVAAILRWVAFIVYLLH